MKNKKFLALALATVLAALLLAGCNGNAPRADQTASGTGKLRVVTTLFPPYDFVRQIAGDNVELVMLVPPGSESHSFEPSPQDIITLNNCDIFIYIGGETDRWVDTVLNALDTPPARILKLIDMVPTVDEEVVAGMQEGDHDHAEETSGQDSAVGSAHVHDGTVDEHVWTSPINAMKIVEILSKELAAANPAYADTYAANTNAYLEKLQQVDDALRNSVQSGVRTTIVVGDRFPFRYMAEEYGLTYYAAFAGCATDTQASAGTVAFLIETVQKEEIPVVFTIEFSNGNIARTICEETGAQSLELHSCHNISQQDYDAGITYYDLMMRNAQNLKEALG